MKIFYKNTQTRSHLLRHLTGTINIHSHTAHGMPFARKNIFSLSFYFIFFVCVGEEVL